MTKKEQHPGGVKLTAKTARTLAMQEFGTARGLTKSTSFVGVYFMEFGNLRIEICADTACIVVRVVLSHGTGSSVKYFDPDTLQENFKATDLNAHANNTDIHVNPSTMGNYDTAISGLIEHKEDTKIHVTAEEKASWTEGAEQAAADANRVTEALNAIAGIESRVSRVEDGLFNNITGNPFLASFDSLDGITLVKGIWNEERKRIEC